VGCECLEHRREDTSLGIVVLSYDQSTTGNPHRVTKRADVDWLDGQRSMMRDATTPAAASCFLAPKYSCDGHIVPFVLPRGRTLGSKKVAKLTFDDVDALLDAKREARLSPSTRRLIRSVLVQATNQAVKWRVIIRNEAAMSTPVPIKRAEGRSLTPEQAKQLMETLKTCPMGSLFTVMLTTGMRRGEALGLRWEDVDLKKGVISVRQQLQRVNGQLKATEVKTERSRRSINLATPTVAALKRHKAEQKKERLASAVWTDTGYVFTTGVGTPLDPRNVAKQFESNCRKAKIGKWHHMSFDTAQQA
jgi:integrase